MTVQSGKKPSATATKTNRRKMTQPRNNKGAGLSQAQLGKETGVTFQQIQKYERGVNRISASKLFEFSNLLDVPVSFFFENLRKKPGGGKSGGLAEAGGGSKLPSSIMGDRETISLLRAYYKIENENVRKKILALIKTLAD